jgi:hypothetical protein
MTLKNEEFLNNTKIIHQPKMENFYKVAYIKIKKGFFLIKWDLIRKINKQYIEGDNIFAISDKECTYIFFSTN